MRAEATVSFALPKPGVHRLPLGMVLFLPSAWNDVYNVPWGGACRRINLPLALVPGWARLAVEVHSELVVLPIRDVAGKGGDVERDHGHLVVSTKG